MNRLRTNTRPTIATAAMAVFALMSGAGLSAQSATEPGKVLRGKAAFGDWREDAPGIRRLINARRFARDRTGGSEFGGTRSQARGRYAARPRRLHSRSRCNGSGPGSRHPRGTKR
jgi:hypothetical protein